MSDATANADNADLPDQIPDPMTDDKDAGEISTDATAADAAAAAEATDADAQDALEVADSVSPAGLTDDEADRAIRHD